jgi:hypothetical protein
VFPGFVTKFRQLGIRSELFAWAFDTDSLNGTETLPRNLGFTFAGIVGKAYGSHARRYKFIEYLLEHSPLEVWGKPNDEYPRLYRYFKKTGYEINRLLEAAGLGPKTRRRLPFVGKAADWNTDPRLPPLHQRYPGRCHAPVYGSAYMDIMARSRVAFNCHTDVADNQAGNIRMYEATGMGACLLTDWQENLTSFFTPEREVVTYRSPEEAAEKARYLLEHEQTRLDISRAGQARTLRDHTYRERTNQLDQIIRGLL